MNFKVTQNGNILDKNKYNWDPETRTFSTTENNLVLDFSELNGCTFKTGSNCTFKTGFNCTFKTESDCIFRTGFNCTFSTGYNCIFKTGSGCIFKTGFNCTFDTGSDCIFKTGSGCTFDTGEKCVCIRRDVFEIIEIPNGQKIKLNGFEIPGFEIINPIRKIKIDNKEIEISESSFHELKKSLIEE